MDPIRRSKVSAIVTAPRVGPQEINGRRYAIPLASTSIFLTAAHGGLGLLIKLFLQQQGFSPLIISSVSSVNAAGVMLGSLFWGRLSDRGARRTLLFITSIGSGIAVTILLLMPPASVILASSFARVFMRMGFMTITIAIISGASVVSRRGKNLSFVTSAQAFGMCAGNAVGGFMLEYLGFRGGFAVAAVLSLAGSAFLFLLPNERVTVVESKQSSWSLALSAGLTDLYISTVLRQMAIHGAFSLLAVYMASVGIPPRYIGLVAAMNTGTQVVAMLVFGRLADRIGRRRIFMLGFALSALTPCVFALSTHILAMMAGYVTLGLGFSSLYIGSTAHIGDRVPPDKQGTMMGLYETSRGLGGILGPLVAGSITPVVGYRGMFLVMACIAALGFLLMYIRRRVGVSQSTQPGPSS